VNRLDYFVLIATILAIPLYGLWRTRGSASLGQYLKGDASIRWATIGLSVLATQAEFRELIGYSRTCCHWENERS